MAAKKKAPAKTVKTKKAAATPAPEPKVEEKKAGMTGFWGSKAVEDFIRNRIGFLAEGCTFDYMPYHEDIRAGRNQFARYDIMCHHKDGELILHYKVNFDSSGRFVPDPVIDNTIALRLMKG